MGRQDHARVSSTGVQALRHVAVFAALALPILSLAQTEIYTYDALGRLKTTTLENGTIITYTYDPAGNRTQVETVGEPIALDDIGVAVDRDTPRSIDVLANDWDPNGDTLDIVSMASPGHGTVAPITINNRDGVRYTPNAGYTGPDSFDYTITDGQSNVSANVSVVVTFNNTAPTAVNDAVSTPEDSGITIYPVANDTDPDNQTLNLVSVISASHGSVQRSGNSVLYTPNADWHGTDSFQYVMNDGELTDTGQVTVTVTSVNDPPVASDFPITTLEDTVHTFDPRGNDTDDDTPTGSLVITATSNASKGAVAILGGTQIRYSPYANLYGTDSFTYTIRDTGNPAKTATATVNVTLNADNDPPIAVDDPPRTTDENVATVFDPRTDDVDVDGPSMTIVAKTNGSKGTVAIINSGTQLRYTPHTNVIGSDSFTYTISDGYLTDTATVTMTINEVNDPPNAVNDTYNNQPRNSWRTFNVRANDSDPNGQSFTITAVSNPAGGQTQIINGGTQVRYRNTVTTLSEDFFGYTITDSGGASDSAVVTVRFQSGGGGFPLF